MSKILTASDVESAPNKRLVLAKGERLTPLARDRAKDLGVELVYSDALPGGATPVPISSTPSTGAPARQRYAPPPAARTLEPTSGSRSALPPSGAMYRRNALGPGGAAPQRGGRPKVAVVGAGHVGATTALRLAESDLFGSVVLVDVVPGLAAGLALDIQHGAGLFGFSTTLEGSDDFSAMRGAEYIVITAGKPRQPGMSRTDLTAVNGEIVESVCKAIRLHAPNSTVVVVTNPLEEMTHLAAYFTGFADERVVGMAGVLDAARF